MDAHVAPPPAAERAMLLDGARCAAYPPEAASFICSRCGDFGCPAHCFSPLAGREVCRNCAAGGLDEPIPWERRREIGWLKAFWETTWLVSKEPVRFFRTPYTEHSATSALLYGLLVYCAGQAVTALLVGFAFLVAGGAVGFSMLGSELDGGAEFGPLLGGVVAGYGCFIVAMTLFQAPFNAVMGIGFAGLGDHGSLWLLGGAQGKSFEDTIRVVSYANAPYLFVAVPCVAIFLWLWVPILEMIGLREVHGASWDKAAFAAFAWRFLFVAAIGGAYLVLVAFIFATAENPNF